MPMSPGVYTMNFDSDVKIIRVEIKDGFEDEVKNVAKLQASGDEPRALVSVVKADNDLLLFFELA